MAQHDIRAIIHLAALQVPFCKADPAAGAKANVVGTVNVFEAARSRGLKRLAYASSIAAHSFFPGAPWLATLYGAYKLCDEMIARTYAGDWDVPSIGIRPGVVYGVGRDQGLTSKTTVAILAAAAAPLHRAVLGRGVGIARRRDCLGVHQGGLNRSATAPHVFDPQRPGHHGRPVAGHRARAGAGRAAGHRGRSRCPFRPILSDEPIREYLGDYGPVPLVDGIRGDLRRLQAAARRAARSPPRPWPEVRS